MCGTPQERALRHVTDASSGEPLDPSLRVSLNFHPDRLVRGVPVIEALARDRVYRSQFETGTSNGGLTAHPGGDRWCWESRIFGTAYDGAPASSRPKYGAVNYLRRAAGAAPRFGSAHFRLTGETLSRTTFCYPDSVFSPVHFGVASRFSALLSKVADSADPLDDYVEAQVHGTVSLSRDVEALVLDPCYRCTEVEELASGLPCRVEWHHGFRLSVDDLVRCEDYRGPEVVRLGLSVAVDGWLDAAVLGAAARAGHDEQLVKRLWHVLARFGALPG